MTKREGKHRRELTPDEQWHRYCAEMDTVEDVLFLILLVLVAVSLILMIGA